MEKVLEKRVCESCGADVREGTQFCYACGKLVAAPQDIAESDAPTSTDRKTAPLSADDLPSVKEKTGSLKPLDPAFESSAPATDSKSKTAANERRQARLASKKPVTLEWQEPDNGVNILFVGVSLFFFILAGLVVVLMFVMK